MAVGISQSKEKQKGGAFLMFKIIKGIIGFVLIVVLIVVIGWVGLNVYSCVTDRTGGTDQPKLPEIAEASHSVYIENTGTLLLTDDYEVLGEEVGSRIFILHGFWELSGQSFKYKAGEIVLDEAIFGKITVKRRS